MTVHWREESHRETPYPSDEKGRDSPEEGTGAGGGTDLGVPEEPGSWMGDGSFGKRSSACLYK